MGCNTFGDCIADARKKQGITQEELCFGICSPGNLSKIENGSTIPRRRTFEALLQRLGQSASLCRLPVSAAEMELYGQLRHALQCIMHNDWESGETLLQACRGRERTDGLCRQFWQFVAALQHSHEGEAPDLVLEELRTALALTDRGSSAMVDPAETDLGQKCLMTYEELLIRNNIAIQYQRKREYEKAYAVWGRLKTYLEVRTLDPDEKDRVYAMILYNYANLLRLMGHWEESLRVCEIGIGECRRSSRYLVLPYLLYCKGEDLKQLGRISEAGDVSVQSDHLFQLYQQDCSCRGEAMPVIL